MRLFISIFFLLFLPVIQGCAKLAVPIQNALSHLTRCDSKLEYRFPLTQVSNPLADFSTNNAGGTVTRLWDSCSEATGTDTTPLLSEHTITRAASSLRVSVGTETPISLEILSNQLSGTLADTCRNGNRAIHSIESGSISSSPRELRFVISTKVVMSSCP